MRVETLGSFAAILGGLAGLAALIRVFVEWRKSKQEAKTEQFKVQVSADDIELRREIDVPGTYGELLEQQRETFNAYRRATDARLEDLAKRDAARDAHMAELDRKLAECTSQMIALTIDRDTLIQHIVEGRGLPLPELRTI